MSKVTMPEPVAIAYESADGLPAFNLTVDGALSLRTGDALITTTQAEAYADARVRGALEEAARSCEALDNNENGDINGYYRGAARHCAARIRALIPPTE